LNQNPDDFEDLNNFDLETIEQKILLIFRSFGNNPGDKKDISNFEKEDSNQCDSDNISGNYNPNNKDKGKIFGTAKVQKKTNKSSELDDNTNPRQQSLELMNLLLLGGNQRNIDMQSPQSLEGKTHKLNINPKGQ